MTAIARMAVLNLRTVAPYRYQGLLVFGAVVLVFAPKSPVALVPALVLLVTSQVAAYPFLVADKAGLETLYAVLPLPRRSVLYGHYAWALACFLATATVGTAVALLLAWAEDVPFSGPTLVTVLTVAWAIFAVNTAIQFPLLLRFGYTRVSILATTLPLAVVILAVLRLHLHVSIESVQVWLPLVWVAGVAAMAASVAVAITTDQQRGGYSGRRGLFALGVIFGTASTREKLGYALPPGRYWLKVQPPFRHGPGGPAHALTAPLTQITVISQVRPRRDTSP